MRQEKNCSKCGIGKPLTDFHKSKIHSDGVRPSCKVCRAIDAKKANRKATTEYLAKRNEATKKWRESNREKYLQLKKESRLARKEEYLKTILTAPYSHGGKVVQVNRSLVYFKTCPITNKLFTAKRKSTIYSPEGLKIHIRNTQNQEHYKSVRKKRRPAQEAILRKAKPEYRIRSNVSRAINQSLKNNSKGASWQQLLGFTIDELKQHLEKQFNNGMSWDNYGKKGWHIDHIRPVSSFSFTSTLDKEFKECWSLNNLQPLWWIDNLKKGDKYVSVIAA